LGGLIDGVSEWSVEGDGGLLVDLLGGFGKSLFLQKFDVDFAELAATLVAVVGKLEGQGMQLFSTEIIHVFLQALPLQFQPFFPSGFEFDVFAEVIGKLTEVDLTPELLALMDAAAQLSPLEADTAEEVAAAVSEATRNINALVDAMLAIPAFAALLAEQGKSEKAYARG
jgi:hypothetical protein